MSRLGVDRPRSLPSGRVAGKRRRSPNLYLVTGWAGLATMVLWLGQFPLYMQGDSVSVYDGPGLARNLFATHNAVFTRILLDLGAYVTAMIFAAAFSQIIRRADPDYAWAGTLAVGAMAVWVGVTLVANGLEGGAALDTLSGRADPSAVRAQADGYLLTYNGPIAFVLTALFFAAAGYAGFATGVLPRWSVGLAFAGVLLCLACVPALYGRRRRLRRPLQPRRLDPDHRGELPASGLVPRHQRLAASRREELSRGRILLKGASGGRGDA